jgi:multiple sugar transport system substrate-binding protein
MRKHHRLAILAAFLLFATACSGGGGGNPSATPTGPVTLTIWHGYTDVEAAWFKAAIKDWNAQHPDITIKPLFVNNDTALHKLTVALTGAKPPDITYQFGSSLPEFAAAPGLVDLTSWVKQPDVGWDDFIPGATSAATFEGKVLGVPALIDNLALVYNKTLFDQAGISYPTADWTWDDFRAAAKALTVPSTKQFGWSYPMDATEDSVWHYDPLLWQNGGSILTPDNTKAAFNSPQGVEALQAMTSMAVDDKSVFLDLQNSVYTQLFNNGKIGMLVTGPWDLSSFPDVDYGVQVLPGFNGDHETIAGPDMWSVFDNGGGRAHAAEEFLQWLTAPAQVKKEGLATGHLPIRLSLANDPPFVKQLGQAYPGVDFFAENLNNVKQARPVLSAYPSVSQAMGNAIVSAMLGQSDPKAALDKAASESNDALAQAAS